MTTVAVATTAVEAEAVTQHVPAGEGYLVAAGAGAAVAFARAGRHFALIEDYQDLDWAGPVMDLADRVVRGWWDELDGGRLRPFLDSWHGIPLREMLELPLYHVVVEAAVSLLTAQRLLNEHPSAHFVLADGVPPQPGIWTGFRLRLRTAAVALVAERRGRHVELPWGGRPPADPTDDLPPFGPRGGGRAGPAPGGPFALVYAEGRHGRGLLPVLAAIRGRGRLGAAFVADEADGQVLASAASAGSAIVAANFDVDPRGVQSIVEEASRAWDSGSLGKLPALGKAELGMPLWPLVSFECEWLARRGIGVAAARATVAFRTIEALRPNVLVTAVDSGLNGSPGSTPPALSASPPSCQLHGSLWTRPTAAHWGRGGEADVVACWGRLTQDWYRAAGVDAPERLPCVGYPLLDGGPRPTVADVDALLRQLGAEPSTPVVTFLVSMTGGALSSHHVSELRIYDELLAAMAELGVLTVIRTHPAADADLARIAAERHSGHVVVNPETDLARLIGASRLVVGQPTTALVEAMALDRPTVLFTHGLASQCTWWLDHGELRRRTHRELARIARRLLDDDDERRAVVARQSAFVARLVGPRDGSSAARDHRGHRARGGLRRLEPPDVADGVLEPRTRTRRTRASSRRARRTTPRHRAPTCCSGPSSRRSREALALSSRRALNCAQAVPTTAACRPRRPARARST